MAAGRRPATPPELPGYTYVRHLGSGGYSDVFLYRQEMPRREVAVKVLLDGAVGGDARQRFADEANAMASLSGHPSIVTIHHADVSADGRPYLVMEYYPSDTLRARTLREPLDVATTLSYGIQIACAVETAHRAGLLHRDIKPANILVNSFGMPALTDFGIAATVADAASEGEEDSGLSVPWSAPEVLRTGRTSTVRSDVFSLAATLYTLLTSRTPFEVPGARNTVTDLMRRIETERPQPLARDDVPVALERLLLRGLARVPHQRPASALAFASALQAVETDLGLPRTPMVVMQATDETDAQASEQTAAATTPITAEPDRWRPPPADAPAVPDADEIDHTRLRVLPEHTLTVQAARDLAAMSPLSSGPRAGTGTPDAGPATAATGPAASTPAVWSPAASSPVGSSPAVPDAAPAARADDTVLRTRPAATGRPRFAEPEQSAPSAPAPVDRSAPRDATRLRARTIDLSGPTRPDDVRFVDVGARAAADDGPAHVAPRRSRRAALLTLVAVLVVVGAAGAAALDGALNHRSGTVTSQPEAADPVAPAIPDRPDAVAGLVVTRSGNELVVRWTNPTGRAGDVYRYWRSDGGADHQVAMSTRPVVTLPAPAAGRVACVSVQVVRNAQQSSTAEACR